MHANAIPRRTEDPERPLVSIVVPVYNESALLATHLAEIAAYMETLESEYRWELLVVDDGSKDESAEIAMEFAEDWPQVRVLRHPRNFGVGQALKFGFANTRGDYVVTLDVDLSYDVRHVGELLDVARETGAKIVLASPYMRGGTIDNVPPLRKLLSVAGNRFLRFFVVGHLSTLTSMVRLYDGPFIRAIDLRATGLDVMPETLYKGMIMRATIKEMPARLDWQPQLAYGKSRSSSLRVFQHMMGTVMSGFVFRPFLFFTFPGLLLAVFSAVVNFWMIGHVVDAYRQLQASGVTVTISRAVKLAYEQYPHTFVIGLLSAMLAIQLIGLGILALQSKHNFEELFHLASWRFQALREHSRDAVPQQWSAPETSAQRIASSHAGRATDRVDEPRS